MANKLSKGAKCAIKRQKRALEARRVAYKQQTGHDLLLEVRAEKTMEKFNYEMRGIMQTQRVSAGRKMHHYMETPYTGEHKFVPTPKTRRIRNMTAEDAEVAIQFGAQLRVDESQSVKANQIVNSSGVVIGVLDYRNLLLLLHGKSYTKKQLPNTFVTAYQFD